MWHERVAVIGGGAAPNAFYVWGLFILLIFSCIPANDMFLLNKQKWRSDVLWVVLCICAFFVAA